MLWRAASALDERSPEATRFCAIAKRVATDTGFNAANDALQLFGGYGYLADYGVEKLVRDLKRHLVARVRAARKRRRLVIPIACACVPLEGRLTPALRRQC